MTTWLLPRATTPLSGDSLSHDASLNGSIVPWPLSGAQSEGPARPTTMAVLMKPSSPPRASSGMSNAIVWSTTVAGTIVTSSNVAAFQIGTNGSLPLASKRSAKYSIPMSCPGFPKNASAGRPVDGFWSVSK